MMLPDWIVTNRPMQLLVGLVIVANAIAFANGLAMASSRRRRSAVRTGFVLMPAAIVAVLAGSLATQSWLWTVARGSLGEMPTHAWSREGCFALADHVLRCTDIAVWGACLPAVVWVASLALRRQSKTTLEAPHAAVSERPGAV